MKTPIKQGPKGVPATAAQPPRKPQGNEVAKLGNRERPPLPGSASEGRLSKRYPAANAVGGPPPSAGGKAHVLSDGRSKS